MWNTSILVLEEQIDPPVSKILLKKVLFRYYVIGVENFGNSAFYEENSAQEIECFGKKMVEILLEWKMIQQKQKDVVPAAHIAVVQTVTAA